MEEITATLAKNLRQMRQALHLTQEELAWRAKVHPSFIGLIERQKKVPSLQTADRLAAALGVDLSELLSKEKSSVHLPKAMVREISLLLDGMSPKQALFFLKIVRALASTITEKHPSWLLASEKREGWPMKGRSSPE